MYSGEGSRPVVLLVENEPLVREAISGVLRRDGFETLSASSAGEATALAQSAAGRIDVLVTDVQLGDGDGIELAGNLRRRMPEMAALVISGLRAFEERAVAQGYGFLTKPFPRAKLLECVRILSGRARASVTA